VLAQSASVWKIYINPKRIADIKDAAERERVSQKVAEKLSKILNVDKNKILKLTQLGKSEYALVKGGVEFAEKEEIANLRGDNAEQNSDTGATTTTNANTDNISYKLYIGIQTDEKRYYTYNNLASSVIGFCGVEGGSYGIERYFNSILAGKPGRILTVKDALGNEIPFQQKTVDPAVQGTNIYLTIDEEIQHYLEASLNKVYLDSGAKGAYGIVMDVNTGAILAMADKPDFNLNYPEKITDVNLNKEIGKITDTAAKAAAVKSAINLQWRNFAVSDLYEPGSVFKIFMTSAAIEEKTWPLTKIYTCTGSINVGTVSRPFIIHCHNLAGDGPENLLLGLENSCNPYFIKVGQSLGADIYFKYFSAFGFTEKTGIELPGEAVPVEGDGGTYHSLANLRSSNIELASSSFGQTFKLSPLQVITATSAIANGGELMQPYIIAKETDDQGNVISETQPYVRRQVISQSTASTVAGMMEKVVFEGKGKMASHTGYDIAGKSGTSEKLDEKGKKAVVASFSCFAPATDAKIAVLIVIDEPTIGNTAGGMIAAPAAADVIANTLKYMGIEPTKPIN
jgi:stage V sporulation protein D (sporulation-specific penicillin-binding protein)